MEHDGECEKAWILEQVRVRMNCTLAELGKVHAKNLCFCWERQTWPGFEVLESRKMDRMATGIAIVAGLRYEGIVKIKVGGEESSGETIDLISDSGDEDSGKVVRVDFQARRRLID